MWTLLPILLWGCQAEDSPGRLHGVTASEAWLEDVDFATIALIGGPVWGHGQLVLIDEDGGRHAYDVALHGGTAGAALELGVAGPFRVNRVDLQLPAPTPGDKILGRYRGWSGSLAVLFGVDHRRLHNGEGVIMNATQLQVGVSAEVGYDWLKMSLDRPSPPEPAETGWEDTGTAHTGWRESGMPEAPPASSSGGCGGASPTPSSGATGSDTAGDRSGGGCAVLPSSAPLGAMLLLLGLIRRRSC